LPFAVAQAPIVTATRDPQAFFTERRDTYARFIRLVRYRPGLRAFFLASPLLRPGLRILDAGCGTGAVTLAVYEALRRRGFTPAALHAFDLTPAMLEPLRATFQRRQILGVELVQADVLHLNAAGRFVLFITRRSPLTRLLIGRWWRSNLYNAAELAEAFTRAGFSSFGFRRFPPSAIHLAPWGHIIEGCR
jgi:SAM-dependent methyltransferase